MHKALVVIDMQRNYNPSDEVVSNCRKQIEIAIKEDMDIIFVEFDYCGPTVATLWEPIKETKYEKVSVISKRGWDGSYEVEEAINKLDHKIGVIRVIGIYTDQCVETTVGGLKNRLSQTSIEVVADACESVDDCGRICVDGHKRGLTRMELIPNVAVI